MFECRQILFFVCCVFHVSFLKEMNDLWPTDCNTTPAEDTCYLIFEVPDKFRNAQKNCMDKGGNLAMISNSKQLSLVVEKYRTATCLRNNDAKSRFWIGVSDDRKEGYFEFVNGTEVKFSFFFSNPWSPTPYGKSYRDKPDNIDGEIPGSDANCVTVAPGTGKLFDDNCNLEKKYICEFKDTRKCNTSRISITNSEHKHCNENTSVPVGHTVSVKCENGYFLAGDPLVTCLNQEKWSTFPKCVEGCNPPNPLPNAIALSLKSHYLLGENQTYFCRDGYVWNFNDRRSHFNMTCGKYGMWIPEHSSCIPEIQYDTEEIHVENGKNMRLQCPLPQKIVYNSMENMQYRWLKDSTNISYFSDCEMDDDGDLTITNFSKSLSGFYSCFRGKDNLVPPKKIFLLKLKKECSSHHQKKVKHIKYREGESVILLCPKATNYHTFAWLKDGKPFDIKSNPILYKDGSLFFKNVVFSDQGIYTCQLIDQTTSCTASHVINITIVASVINVCGRLASVQDHPWTVSLWQKNDIAPFCYGTLINENWIITAAQCLAFVNRKAKVELFAKFVEDSNQDVRRKITTVIIHPTYSKRLHINDVGFVKLKNPIRFAKTVQPICVTDSDLNVKGACGVKNISGVVSGWGALNQKNLNYTRLVDFMTLSICYHRNFDNKRFICFEVASNSKAKFPGDAGSPIEIIWKGRVYLLGIYSWGEEDAFGYHNYHYFTKISNYMPWIKSVVDKE